MHTSRSHKMDMQQISTGRIHVRWGLPAKAVCAVSGQSIAVTVAHAWQAEAAHGSHSFEEPWATWAYTRGSRSSRLAAAPSLLRCNCAGCDVDSYQRPARSLPHAHAHAHTHALSIVLALRVRLLRRGEATSTGGRVADSNTHREGVAQEGHVRDFFNVRRLQLC